VHTTTHTFTPGGATTGLHPHVPSWMVGRLVGRGKLSHLLDCKQLQHHTHLYLCYETSTLISSSTLWLVIKLKVVMPSLHTKLDNNPLLIDNRHSSIYSVERRQTRDCDYSHSLQHKSISYVCVCIPVHRLHCHDGEASAAKPIKKGQTARIS
jgi:hypothetical protein